MSSPLVAERVNRRLLHSGRAEGAMCLSEYPVEMRVYREGSEMQWHRDDMLYDTPQCEMVLCLENTSDSRTEWIDADGELHSEWTPPNSCLLLRAGDSGARHRVQPLRRGERTILKSVWAPHASERLEAFFTHLDSLPGLRTKQRPRQSDASPRKNARSMTRKGKAKNKAKVNSRS
jgi:hypothetical protein